MCSTTLSPEERVVRARAQCGACAQFVETYCLDIAARILRNLYSGASRTFEKVLDEYVQPRVSRQIIDPFGSYNPAYKLTGYLPKLVEHAWSDYCRDTTEEGGRTVLIDDLRRPDGTDDSDLLPAWDLVPQPEHTSPPVEGSSPDHPLQQRLRDSGFDDRDGEIIRQTYAEGRTAADVSDEVGCQPTTVGQVNARFRDLCLERPITQLMSAAGFSAADTSLVLEFFTEHLFALRRDSRQADRTVDRWESRLDERRCLRKIAKDRKTSGIAPLKARAASPAFDDAAAVQFLQAEFQRLLVSPSWDRGGRAACPAKGPVDPARLTRLRTELVDRLRNDEDWLRHVLPSVGIPPKGVDAYLRLWSNQQFDTVFRVLSDGGLDGPRPAVLSWLGAIKEHDPQLIWQLPHRVRRWYFESLR